MNQNLHKKDKVFYASDFNTQRARVKAKKKFTSFLAIYGCFSSIYDNF